MAKADEKIVEVECYLVTESRDAIKISFLPHTERPLDEEDIWLPKSLTTLEETLGNEKIVITIPEWLAIDKEIEDHVESLEGTPPF